MNRHVIVLLFCLLFYVMGWHHVFSQTSTSSSADSSALEELLEKPYSPGSLPENFVSVGILTGPNSTFKHLVGGFLIHPGVVLTSSFKHSSLKNLQEYFEQFISLKPQNLKEKLYILFKGNHKVPQSEFLTKTKINDIILYPTKRGRAKYNSFALLFFETSPKLSHIKPLPLATTKDLKSFEEARGDQMWTVGIGGYTGEVPYIQESGKVGCPLKHAQLGKMVFSKTPTDYHWISNIIHVFPGRIQPLLTSTLYQKAKPISDSNTETETVDFEKELTSKPFQEILDYIFTEAFCHRSDSFCTEPLPLDHANNLQFQCPEHMGYPILWRSPSKEWKALGMSWVTAYPFVEPSPEQPPETIAPKLMISGHFDLIYAHSWIRSTIRKYAKKHSTSSFTLDEEILEIKLDHSIEDKLQDNTQYFEFLVGLSFNSVSCFGAVIEKGVVVTAAHCLKKHPSYLKETLYLLFYKEGKTHVTEAKKTYIHPRYGESHRESRFAFGDHKLADLALIFFDPSEDVTPIKKITFAHDVDQVLDQIIKGKGELFTLSTVNQIDKAYLKLNSWPHSFLWNKALPLRDAADYIEREASLLFSNQLRKQELFSFSKKLTQVTVDEKTLSKRLFQTLQHKDHNVQISVCSQKPWICVWNYPGATRLEKAAASCFGSSGSPLIGISPQGDPKILGVLSRSASSQGAAPIQGCSPRATFTRISTYLPWIAATIKKERTRRSGLLP